MSFLCQKNVTILQLLLLAYSVSLYKYNELFETL